MYELKGGDTVGLHFCAAAKVFGQRGQCCLRQSSGTTLGLAHDDLAAVGRRNAAKLRRRQLTQVCVGRVHDEHDIGGMIGERNGGGPYFLTITCHPSDLTFSAGPRAAATELSSGAIA